MVIISKESLKSGLRVYHPIVVVLILAILAGCCKTSQLERVAKDWCLTIRASQVIPVYPLTEDIQPGDVFLVQTPIEEQVKVYESKGFLPLDNHLVRLQPKGYSDFYSGGYAIGTSTIPPRHWQFASTQISATNYANAPRSAFPSYTFSVSRSEGFNMAIPVYGIPVGLNLLDSSQASGSIAITDAYTYGIGMLELEQLVLDWANRNEHFIKQFSPPRQTSESKKSLDTITDKDKQKRNYLRVVNRVYLTGKVNISLFSDKASGSAASGGLQKPPVDFLNLGTETAAGENFNKVNTILSKNMTGGMPGGTSTTTMPILVPAISGTLKVVAASSRSVSLDETFARPLVIGYIAFDLPILEDGRLGPPLSTQSQLTGEKIDIGQPIEYGPDENTQKIRDWLKKDNNRVKLKNWLKNAETQKWLKDYKYNQVITEEHTITHILNGGNYGPLRAEIVHQFTIP